MGGTVNNFLHVFLCADVRASLAAPPVPGSLGIQTGCYMRCPKEGVRNSKSMQK